MTADPIDLLVLALFLLTLFALWLVVRATRKDDDEMARFEARIAALEAELAETKGLRLTAIDGWRDACDQSAATRAELAGRRADAAGTTVRLTRPHRLTEPPGLLRGSRLASRAKAIEAAELTARNTAWDAAMGRT